MPKYPFSAIVENIKDKRMPVAEDQFSYIGLEHLDSGRFIVSRQGSPAALKGSKLIMKKGDILFGKRNAYLRRVAIAPHDGLFSAHGMIFRPKKAIDASFAPFFLRSDNFMQAAIDISVGSISPTVNWSDLKDLEFYLPPLSKQKELAKVLWAIEEAVEKYESLLLKCDELVKSRFVEMFGDLQDSGSPFPKVSFLDCASFDLHMTYDFETYGGLPHIGIDNIERNTGVLFGYRTAREDGIVSGKYLFTHHHLIYSKIRPNLNKVALPTFDGLCSADAYPILPKSNIKREFLAFVMRDESFLSFILKTCNRSGMPKTNKDSISRFSFHLPPLDMQEAYLREASSIDKLKFNLQRAIDKAKKMSAKILNDALSTEE